MTGRRGGLLRQRNFRLFWPGENISEVGNSVTLVVIPLVAIDTLHTSTFIVTLIAGAAGGVFNRASQAVLPGVVDEPDAPEGNPTLLRSREVAQTGRPGLGGLLAQA